MSFEEIITRLGETGELGENPRQHWLSGRAKKGLISPAKDDGGESLAPVSPALAQPNPAPINGFSPFSPFSPDEIEKHWHWIVSFQFHALEVFTHPPADKAELRRQYPAAWEIEPAQDIQTTYTPPTDGDLVEF